MPTAPSPSRWVIRDAETLGTHTFIVTGETSGTASATFQVIARGTLPSTGPNLDPGTLAVLAALALVSGAAIATAVRRRHTS